MTSFMIAFKPLIFFALLQELVFEKTYEDILMVPVTFCV